VSEELIVTEEQKQELMQQVPQVQDIQNVFQDKEKFDMVLRGAMALSKSTIVPATYQNKPENCFIAINLSNRMGVDPLIVMQNLYVVQGKPSWSGQACKMLIENCGKFKSIKHVYTGEKGKDSWGCRIVATRKEDGDLIEGPEVNIEMAKKEGWYSKGGSKWQSMPELMLAYRAAAFFARVHAPEALMGMTTAEEVDDYSGKPQKAKVVDVLD
jgi:hypothetical protein